jgi:hypothetical protein
MSFRDRCDNINGIVQFNEEGILMQCVEPASMLGSNLVVYFDEFTPQQEEQYSTVVDVVDTEQNRLAVYLSIVYNATPLQAWSSLSLQQLTNIWQSLEFWYVLPSDIMPQTPIPNRRPEREAIFYRMPDQVVLEQPYLYTLEDGIPSGQQIEVCHFGSINVSEPYKPIQSFTGTYFYRSRGSGTSISTGPKTLVAWNKVHALVLLGVPNEDIYANAGLRFKTSVKERSRTMTQALALSTVVTEMSQGKCLSVSNSSTSGGLTYYGLGEMGDSFLALQALTQGYSSLQLVREAQFLPVGSRFVNPVGFEFIRLLIPSQASEDLQVDLVGPLV